MHIPCLRLDERVLAEMQRRVYCACRLRKSRPKLRKAVLIVPVPMAVLLNNPVPNGMARFR